MSINVENLRLAIRVLQECPNPEDFRMSRYRNFSKGFDVRDILRSENMPESACGTPACVLGNLAARTDLQKRFMLIGMDVVKVNGDGSVTPIAYHDASVQNFFGINNQQADELFGAEGCGAWSLPIGEKMTPARAIKYIEDFIEKNADQ